MSNDVLERTRRFLDYLAALARELTTKPERDVRQYAVTAPIWPDQVPVHHGVILGPGEDRPAWLVVKKVQEPPLPQLPAELVDEVNPASLEDLDDGPRLRATEPSDTEPGDRELSDMGNPRVAGQLLQRDLDAWIAAQWRPWAVKAQPARAARRLYSDLFGLHLFLQANQ